MNTEEQIAAYINSQSDAKRIDMENLHRMILEINPNCQLWYLDGKSDEGKIVYNTNIGYGAYTIKYADGTSREFYQIGFSGNTSGISVYIMGLDDKKHLAETYGETMGKASVTSYCIKFKALKDINLETLKAAISYGFEYSSKK